MEQDADLTPKTPLLAGPKIGGGVNGNLLEHIEEILNVIKEILKA